MKTARMIGNYAQNRAQEIGISIDEMSRVLEFSKHETEAFLKGRILLTYKQLTTLADRLGVSAKELIEGNDAKYSSTVVHCMNGFNDEKNREKILDIIDDYMDIVDAMG